VLVDCGLSQGERFCEKTNNEIFAYEPKDIDAIFFTHAHADHIGLYPKLVNAGFKGVAYATKPTRELMPIMLVDSAAIMAHEAKVCHESPPYEAADVGRASETIKEISYNTPVAVGDHVKVTLYNAGHILGSASVCVEAGGRRVLFTGDLGRTPAVLVPDREVPENVDVLVTESVYGNRVHHNQAESDDTLARAVQRTHKEKGVLLIPAFSLERTQILLRTLERLMREGKVPEVPVFMDSPLAAKVTEVYRSNPEFLRPEIQDALQKGEDPFSFPSLRVTVNKEASELIDTEAPPKIIIAGAGMSHGGRIRRHELLYLGNPSTTLLMVGYQVAGSLGRRLKDGQKEVEIDGKRVRVRATVDSLDGYSAHADMNDLLKFAEEVHPKRVFVVLGETEAATFLAQRISGFLGIEVDVPREGETYEL
jgi:metallo-beta-lactamase family protein